MRQNNVFVSVRDFPKCSCHDTLDAGRGSDAGDMTANVKIVRKIRATDFILLLRCSRTDRLRQAGPVMSDCKPRADPGLACSRMVGRHDNHGDTAWVYPPMEHLGCSPTRPIV